MLEKAQYKVSCEIKELLKEILQEIKNLKEK